MAPEATDDFTDDLLTAEEVMEQLLAIDGIKRVASTCALTAVRHGLEWRFRRSDLDAWIKTHLAASEES